MIFANTHPTREAPARGGSRGAAGIDLAQAQRTIAEFEDQLAEARASSAGQRFEIRALDHQTRKTGRRLAFARWVTDPQNPLTARVYVNRVWQKLFGRGIVRTLDNFGKTGARPTHPALLDWLSVEFVKRDWSSKQLLRLMVTSRAYRQQSVVSAGARKGDPENLLLSRMPLKRLQAESVRDFILQLTLQLSSEKSGPPRPVKEMENGLILSSELERGGWARSIYVIHRRSKIPTLMETFDYPQMGPNCIARKNSIVPQQALHLTNNAQVRGWCDALARSLVLQFQADRDAMIRHLWESAYGTEPRSSEVALWREYLNRLKQKWQLELEDGTSEQVLFEKSLATLCHTVVNSASFMYVD